MKKFLLYVISLSILLLAAFYAFNLFRPFSEGDRSGELIKFSRKGVIFKTWEGELSQGLSGSQIFVFSVDGSNKEIIQKLEEYNGDYVQVKYEERFFTFPWTGDSKYYITQVTQEQAPRLRGFDGQQQMPQNYQQPYSSPQNSSSQGYNQQPYNNQGYNQAPPQNYPPQNVSPSSPPAQGYANPGEIQNQIQPNPGAITESAPQNSAPEQGGY